MKKDYPKFSLLKLLMGLLLLLSANFANAQCTAPSGVTTSDEAATSVTVSWNVTPSENGGEYQYEVRTSGAPGSSVDPATGYVLSGSTTDGLLSTTVEQLNFSTDYFVYVRYACSTTTFSPWTAAVAFSTTTLQPPVALAAIYISDDSFLARWNPSAGASAYRLDVSTEPDFDTFVTGYEDLAVGITSHVVAELTPSTTYYYRVRAEGTGGAGFVTTANSNIITVSTLSTPLSFVVWTQAGWSGDPLLTLDAIIDWDYDTSVNQVFEAKSLTINNPYTLTIAAGTYVIVDNEVVNNSENEGLVIQNNGNLLQLNDAAVNSGQAFVYRNSSALFRLDYTMWSSPVFDSEITLKDFSPLTLDNRFYTYSTTTDLFNAYSPLNTWEQGKGYLIRTPNNHSPYVDGSSIPEIWTGLWQGKPGNGVVSVPVSDAGQGFNMIGNPYPSVVSIENFFNVNEDAIDGIIYFWRRKNSSVSGDTGSYYATYTNLGGTASDTSEEPNGFIQTGQGFLVKAKPGATSVVFNNSVRVSDNFENQFFKMTAPERHRLWLNLTTSSGVFGQTLIGYMEGASNGFDNGIDGRYINDSDVALTSLLDNSEYIIQGRPLPFSITDAVPLRFKTPAAGTFTIALDNFDGLFAQQDVFLHDVTANLYYDLKSGNYTFSSAAGTFDARFEIVYNNPQLGVNNPGINAAAITAYTNSGTLYIAAGSRTINSVTLFDLAGRKVYSAEVNASEASFSDINVKGQVLLAEVMTNEGKVTKKIVL